MENGKFLKIVIVILLLINIATLGFMWSRHPHEGPPGQPPEDTFMFLTRELKLDEKQQEQFRTLKSEHHESVEAIQKQNKQLHDNFFDLLHKSLSDSVAVNLLADSMANNQKQITVLTFNHFAKVRALCTPEQQKKFDSVINEALGMLARRPQRH